MATTTTSTASRFMGGIDPATMNLSIVKYYPYLLTKFADNAEEVAKYLGQEGFIATFTFGSANYTPEMLAKLGLAFKEAGVVSVDFDVNQNLSKVKTSIVVLKYMEIPGARYWKNVWAKQCRGVVLFVNPETLDVTVLNYKLPRGAEVLTGMHASSNISESQDINVKKGTADVLDAEQQDTFERLSQNNDIEAVLTSKADGSLLVVTAYSGKTLHIMKCFVDTFGGDYVEAFATMSLTASNQEVMLVPATNGTFWESGFMQDYMVTSILCGFLKGDRKDMQNMTSLEAFVQHGIPFIQALLEMRSNNIYMYPGTEAMTFSFEAICSLRTGCFKGNHVHAELAISYDSDRLAFLGTSFCDELVFIPHSETKNNRFEIEEPLYWRITHASQINEMMHDMEALLVGKITKATFLAKWVPSNPDWSNEKVESAIIDFEGWVLMKKATFDGSDPWIYSKIKTVAYYKAHKYRPENIEFLFELAKTAGDIFPLARKLADMLAPGVFEERMSKLQKDFQNLLDMSHDDGKAYMAELTEYFAQKELAAATEASSKKKGGNPLTGLEKRPLLVQAKILVNQDPFSTHCLRIFKKHFQEMDLTHKDLGSCLKGIVMKLELWTDEKIKSLKPIDESISELVSACIGTSISAE